MAALLSDFIKITEVTPAYWRATFSDPPLNLMGDRFFNDLTKLLDAIEASSNLKVIVFDSAAPDFWIAHYDALGSSFPWTENGWWWKCLLRFVHAPVLTIASIRGRARGGGNEFALGLDVRFGSREQAIISQFEITTGTLPAGGALEWLPAQIGRSRALEVVLGGEDFTADIAEKYGLINRAVPDAELDEFVDKFARRVASFDKPAIAVIKKLVNKRCELRTADDWLESAGAFMQRLTDPDVQDRVKIATALGFSSKPEFELNLPDNMAKLN
ncbi:ClpP/crotonase-like domain-containing protein [Trichoderma sp. SZMC 28014]